MTPVSIAAYVLRVRMADAAFHADLCQIGWVCPIGQRRHLAVESAALAYDIALAEQISGSGRLAETCRTCSGGGRVANVGTRNASRQVICQDCYGLGSLAGRDDRAESGPRGPVPRGSRGGTMPEQQQRDTTLPPDAEQAAYDVWADASIDARRHLDACPVCTLQIMGCPIGMDLAEAERSAWRQYAADRRGTS